MFKSFIYTQEVMVFQYASSYKIDFQKQMIVHFGVCVCVLHAFQF